MRMVKLVELPAVSSLPNMLKLPVLKLQIALTSNMKLNDYSTYPTLPSSLTNNLDATV
jgi:hypothetical protein